MQDFDTLASDIKKRVANLGKDKQLWIGIAGAPGSGKSTLARELECRLGKSSIVIPMDGYHHYRSDLDAMKNPKEAHARRGSPFTFNASKFLTDLINARKIGEGLFPSFDHNIGDPIENDIYLNSDKQIVLVEGNYLLLDDEPWCQLHQKVFDETWFLDIDEAECIRRLSSRHIETGLSERQAKERAEGNDSINGKLIAQVSPSNADRVIRLSNDLKLTPLY